MIYAETLFRHGAVQRALGLDRMAAPAHYLEQAGDLRAALIVNPRFTPAWIALGLDAERDKRGDEAEFDLLEAARVDRRYLPAWTLANFYFRGGDPVAFWPWARRAARLAYDDLRPVLQLGHSLEPDALVVLDKLGGGERLMRADLDYLAGASRWDEAQQVARLMLANGEADRPRLLEMTDRQIRSGHAAYALELWKGLSPPLDPFNRNLKRPPSGVGFDWRLPGADGITAQWERSQLTFSLSGAQPESCALLEQVTVRDNTARHYRLSLEYRTTGLPLLTGIRWSLDQQESTSLAASEAWRAGQAIFSPSIAGTKMGLLRLVYRREPGTVRSQGRFELRHISMEDL